MPEYGFSRLKTEVSILPFLTILDFLPHTLPALNSIWNGVEGGRLKRLCVLLQVFPLKLL